MTIAERITEDLKAAMKERDAERLGVLRMIKARLKNDEIEAGGPLAPAAEVAALMKLAKQRRESIEQYERFGRHEQAMAEKRELQVLEEYLPSAPTEEEIGRAIDEVRAEGGDAVRQMGPLMQRVMARFAGRPVDGKLVSALVRSRLAG